jgi:hypothetical protein
MTVVLGLHFDVDSEQGEGRNGFICEGGLGRSIKKKFLSHAISIFAKLEFPPVYAAAPFAHFYYRCCRNCSKPV